MLAEPARTAVRRALAGAAAAALLAGPTALAFFAGGYFAEPRLIAGLVAWALVLASALAGPLPLPLALPGRLAVGGLVLLTAWSALSLTWAPVAGPALASVQRLVLYVGALLLAVATFRGARARRAVEPALAAGGTLVIAYGLGGRLLPGIVDLASSRSAGGRLEQPITYWNGEGALAAVAVVLCAHLAGDRTRPLSLRDAAAAAIAPLGAGVYLSYSRGAIAVALLGLVVLVAAAPSRAQLHAAVVAVATAAAAAVAAGAFAGVASLAGTRADRVREGAVVLGLLTAIGLCAALATARRARAREQGAPEARADEQGASSSRAGDQGALAIRPGPVAVVATGAVALGLALGGVAERPSAAELAAGARPARLTSASSNRYEYWRVGRRAFARQPVSGLGAGGFRVEWLRQRTIHEAVRDAHSLPIEMAAELGLVGLLAFGLMVGGAAAAARTALRRDPALAAGWCAATLAWLLHAGIDWDWRLPAVSLPAIVLTGALIALAEPPSRPHEHAGPHTNAR